MYMPKSAVPVSPSPSGYMPKSATPVSEPTQPSGGNSIFGAAKELGKAIVKPAFEFAKFVGEAGYQGARAVADPEMRKAVFNPGSMTDEDYEKLGTKRQTLFMNPEDIKSRRDIALTGAKRTAGAAAYAVPGAGAGSTVTKAALGGAATGGLTGFAESEEGNELGDTLAGVGTGAALGGAMQAGGKMLSKFGKKSTDAAVRTEEKLLENAGKAPRVSDVAAKTYAGIWQVPKNKGTRNLNPTQTARELIELDVQPSSLDDLVEKSGKITGSDGILSKAVRASIGNVPEEIDINRASTVARNSLKGKLGLSDAAEEIEKSILEITPVGKGVTTTNTLDAFDVQRQLQEQAADFRGEYSFSRKPKAKYLAEAYEKAAQEIGDQIDNKVGKYSLVENSVNPEDMAVLEQISPILAERVRNARTIRELRSLQKPFVNAMRLADLTNDQTSRILNQELRRGTTSALGIAGGGMVGGPVGAVAGNVVANASEPLISAFSDRVKVPISVQSARAVNAASKASNNPVKKKVESTIQKKTGEASTKAGSALMSKFAQKSAQVGTVGSKKKKED